MNNTMYNLVSDTIFEMEIGEVAEIKLPDNLPYFRKYLSEISKREGKKFTTKVTTDKKGRQVLQIMRIKYSNIYSKEVE